MKSNVVKFKKNLPLSSNADSEIEILPRIPLTLDVR